MIDIVLDDAPVLAVNKPAGILTQGPPSVPLTLESLVKQHLKETQQKPGNVYLGVPHRLDRAVSGVVLFAKNSKGAARLAEIFRDRRVKKTYLAVVEACPASSEGELTDGILKTEGVPYAEIVPVGTPSSQEAKLTYRVVREVTNGWLLEVNPETGRFHQIRAQLAAKGWPVIGDVLYGSKIAIDPSESSWVDDGSETAPTPIALHAHRLDFPHPIRFTPISAIAPPPTYWETRGWAI